MNNFKRMIKAPRMSHPAQNKLINFFFIGTLIFFLTSFASAQGVKNSYKILGISVEGNRSADARTIIVNCGLKIDDEIQIPGDQTINAIRQLWSLNIFSDVQIVIDKQIGDGVFLLIKVEEYNRVEKIIFRGNDDVSTSDLEKKVNLIRGQILKPQEVQRMKVIIQKMYDEEGLLNAEISPKYFIFYKADTSKNDVTVTWRNKSDFAEEYSDEYSLTEKANTNLIEKIKDRILLVFDIKENDQVKVREIKFVGNKAFDDDDLKSELKETTEKVWWKFWNSAKFDRVKFDEDKKLIQKFYQKSGYRDAEIIKDSIVYLNDKKDMHIYLYVHEGPQYKVRNITWEGNTIYTSEFLTERLGFVKGEVFDYDKFNQNLRQNERQNDISSLYLDNGYLTFRL
ncbi:MAG: POTRA domain-containing protein, partial [Ignavibacteriaceae bacterium]|nr:POTRA domain-containing protein [Ignavibacteriaceae bacterium]